MKTKKELELYIIDYLKVKSINSLSATIQQNESLLSCLKNNTTFLNKSSKISERLYCIHNNINHLLICPICNEKPLKYIGFNIGYTLTCGYKCSTTRQMLNAKSKEFKLLDKEVFIKMIDDMENIRSLVAGMRLNADKLQSLLHYTKYIDEYDKVLLSERLYCLYNNIKERPMCYCGKKHLNFIEFKLGYYQFCSAKCSANSKEIRSKYVNTCLELYGVDNVFKSKELMKDVYRKHSKVSQELFWSIYNKLDDDLKDKCNFGELNDEIQIEGDNKFFSIDFCVDNIIIEFYGDFWHRNPNVYNGDEIIKGMLTTDIWDYDKKRIEYLKQKDFKILSVWEDDYTSDKNKIIKECLKFLTTY